jgi:hypothetical protein
LVLYAAGADILNTPDANLVAPPPSGLVPIIEQAPEYCGAIRHSALQIVLSSLLDSAKVLPAKNQ